MNRLLISVIAASLCANAFAHGGEKHRTVSSEIKQEQKPWGIAGQARDVKRTIEISMSDAMRFTPDQIRVQLGETVKFVVRNKGRAMHEMVIGTRDELEAHAELMQKFPDMEHDEPYMAHVEPQKKEEMIWTFNRPGQFEFACLIPGHFSAGMKGLITVADAAAGSDWTRAEVRRVDASTRKLTLRHEEIRSLSMPPMTMVFHLADEVSAEGLKAGDAIRFQVEKIGNKYVVRQLERQP